MNQIAYSSNLIQIIYCSAASRSLSQSDLDYILQKARHRNKLQNITGMLLYAEGSFFQVLEGDGESVDTLYADILSDRRHENVTLIIREPVTERSFADWTMGYADIKSSELDEIMGANDFFTSGRTFTSIGSMRARKLLSAFMEGRWRTKLTGPSPEPEGEQKTPSRIIPVPPVSGSQSPYTFAFQPIIHAQTGTIFSYEALIRGRLNEPAGVILNNVEPSELHAFHEQCRIDAIELAVRLGIETRLNINFLPSSLGKSPKAVSSILETVDRCGINPSQIVLEILESELIRDYEQFSADLKKYKSSGLAFAIDDFGAGYAGLNMLAEFQPDLVKLDMMLVRGIDNNGPRQAIVRGIMQTCTDLGIDIIAEGIETTGEYEWFLSEGISLFQGYLLARPSFEILSKSFYLPAPAM